MNCINGEINWRASPVVACTWKKIGIGVSGYL